MHYRTKNPRKPVVLTLRILSVAATSLNTSQIQLSSGGLGPAAFGRLAGVVLLGILVGVGGVEPREAEGDDLADHTPATGRPGPLRPPTAATSDLPGWGRGTPAEPERSGGSDGCSA